MISERVSPVGLEVRLEDPAYVRHLPISLDTIQKVQAMIDGKPLEPDTTLTPTQTTGEKYE